MADELSTLSRVYVLVTEFLVTYSFQLLGAVLILVGGTLVSRAVGRAVLAQCERKHVDIALALLLAMLARLGVLALFVLIALAKLGISIAPLIAAVGGAAVGVGLALQGTLSNYGAGLSIILGRMFRVGDSITVLDRAGIVQAITLAVTRLRNEDGEDIIIPNRKIVGEVHVNSYANRVIEASLCIDYADDPRRMVALIAGILARSEGVVADHPPHVGIESFAPGGILIGYRFWALNTAQFTTRHQVNAAIYEAARAEGIRIVPVRAS